MYIEVRGFVFLYVQLMGDAASSVIQAHLLANSYTGEGTHTKSLISGWRCTMPTWTPQFDLNLVIRMSRLFVSQSEREGE